MKRRVKSYELRVASWLAMAVVCTMCARAGLGATGMSEEFSIDTRSGIRETDGNEQLTYSPDWVEGGVSATILTNGAVMVEELTVDGTQVWTAERPGTYTLMHQIKDANGVVLTNETAQFMVTGVPFPDGVVKVSGWSGMYDGSGHGVLVSITGVANCEISYSKSANGPYRGDEILFTNTCTETIWCVVTAGGYMPSTNSAVVNISRRLLDPVAIVLGPEPVYSGQEVTQQVQFVRCNGIETTFNVSGNVAVEPGDYALEIEGTGNYYGIIRRQWNIVDHAEVNGLSARQRYPWNGIVDIDYEIENSACDACYKIKSTAVDVESKAVIGMRNLRFSNALENTASVTGGVGRIMWNAEEDVAGLFQTGMVDIVVNAERVNVGSRIVPGKYCVIDLSGAVDTLPVTYLDYTEERNIPACGWTDEFKTEKLVLRYVEPGTFNMGDLQHENYDVANGVEISRGFYIGVFEVTQRQWELVMGDRPSSFTNENCYAARPVEGVEYEHIRGDDAGQNWPLNDEVDDGSFLGRLREKTGLRFDLPTEAQWEYACRAGTSTDFNNGTDYDFDMMWWTTDNDEIFAVVGRDARGSATLIGEQYTTEWDADLASGTAKVGKYVPNAWGLYDMHGNVSEWCRDYYGEMPSSGTEDPMGAASGDQRIVRGGGIDQIFQYTCTSWYRYGISYGTTGFRIMFIPEEGK